MSTGTLWTFFDCGFRRYCYDTNRLTLASNSISSFKLLILTLFLTSLSIPPSQQSPDLYANLTSRWVKASSSFSSLIWPERERYATLIEEFLSHSSSKSVTEQCRQSARLIIEGLKANKMWAIKFLDSSGKGRSGMAYGYTSDAGNLDECISNDVTLTATSSGSKKKTLRLNGKYCLVNLHLPLPRKEDVNPLTGITFNLTGTALEDTPFTLYARFTEMMVYTPAGFRFGLCIPASCEKGPVENFVNYKLSGTELSVTTSPYCDTIDEGFPLRDKIVITVITLYVLFVTFTSFWTSDWKGEWYADGDVWNQSWPQPVDESARSSVRGASWIYHWNAFDNMKKLSVETKDPLSRQISFFHGIRFWYQCAAITIHSVDIFPFIPTAFAVFYIRDWSFGGWAIWPLSVLLEQAYASIGFFVQIPLAISGFLTYVIMFPYFQQKKGNVHFFDYTFKRWLRTTPTLLGVLLCSYGLSAVGRGPVHREVHDLTIGNCAKWWWTNLLYINNWWHYSEMCLFHTWTFSVDFQLYLLAYITFVLMVKDKRLGVLSIFSFIVLGCFMSGFVTYIKDLSPYPNFHARDARQYENATWFYFHTYHGIPSYFVGILVAFLFLEKKKISEGFWFWAGWVTLVGMGLATQIIPMVVPFDGISYRWLEILFGAFHRLFFLCMWVWTGYLACFNMGWVIQWVYEIPYFIPFGRMSTSVFLAHYTFIWFDLANSNNHISTKPWDLIMRGLYIVVASFLYSFAIYLLFEAPSMSIAKAWLRKGQAKPPEKQDSQYYREIRDGKDGVNGTTNNVNKKDN